MRTVEVDENGQVIAPPAARPPAALQVDENGKVQQAQASRYEVDENGQVVATAQEGPSTAKVRGSFDPIKTSLQYIGERLFNRVPGQFGAAERIALDRPRARKQGPMGVGEAFSSIGDPVFWDTLKLGFPGISGEKPNVHDFDNVAQRDPEFARVWGNLKQLKADSEQAAKETYGGATDWEAATKRHRDLVYDSVSIRTDLGEKSTPENPFPKASDPDEMERYAAQTAVPGLDRAPVSEQEMLDAAMQILQARSEDDIGRLNPYARAAMRGAAVGGPMALAVRFVPGGALAQAAFGAIYETARQALGLESGAQKEFNKGEIALSALLMGGAAKVGQAAARAFPMIPKTAALVGQVGTFEAAAGARAVIDRYNRPKAEAGAPGAEQGPSAWQTAAEHIIESAVAVGIGILGTKGEWKRPVEGGAEATEVTAKSIREWFRANLKLGRRFEPERIGARKLAVEEKFVPLEAEMLGRVRTLDRALDKASGGNKELRAQINDATRIALESQGKIPVNEKLVLPDKFQYLMDLQRKVGETALKLGEFKYARGEMPYARYRLPGQKPGESVTVAEGEPAPAGGLLIGGIKFPREQGFYFPRITKEGALIDTDQPFAELGKGEGGGANLPSEEMRVGELAAKHNLARQLTFEEAMNQRPLDLSLGKAYEVFVDQSYRARKDGMLDLSRAEGDLLTKDELPDNNGMEKMRTRAADLRNTIKGLKEGFEGLTPFDQIRRRNQIVSLRSEAEALESGSKGKLYRKYSDPKSKYDGMYLHRDVQARINATDPTKSGVFATMQELGQIIRTSQIGFNLKAWAQDFIGNEITYAENGVNIGKATPKAMAKSIGLKQKTGIDHEFDVQASRATFGGSPDIAASELNQLARYKRQIAELDEAGHSTGAMKTAAFLARRGELTTKLVEMAEKLPGPLSLAKFPAKALDVFFQIPQGRRLLVDMAQARAAYTVLREQGVPPVEAFEKVAAIADYRTLSSPIQGLANAATYLRWPSKYLQAQTHVSGRMKPSIFGKKIPTPMDAVIESAPGSAQARIALVTRGLMRMATNTARWLPFLAGTQLAAMKELGIKKEDLDRQLDDRFDYLPGPLAWLSKRVYIPTSITPSGQIDGIDAGQFIPALVAMRYFMSSSKTAPIWWQVLQKNQYLGPLAQGIAAQDYGAHAVPKGAGPGESWWKALTLALPKIPVGQVEEYFQQQRVPENERSALRGFLRSVAGVPLTKLSDRSFFQKEVERLYAQGSIGRTVSDNGRVTYYPNNQFDVYSEAMIAGMRDPANATQAIMRIHREKEAIMQAMEDAAEMRSGAGEEGVR